MLYAMNIDTINRRFYHDLSFRVNTTIPEQYGQFHDSSIPGYPYNLSKAKHLLDKAGYKYQKGAKFRRQPNGKPLTINLAVDQWSLIHGFKPSRLQIQGSMSLKVARA